MGGPPSKFETGMLTDSEFQVLRRKCEKIPVAGSEKNVKSGFVIQLGNLQRNLLHNGSASCFAKQA